MHKESVNRPLKQASGQVWSESKPSWPGLLQLLSPQAQHRMARGSSQEPWEGAVIYTEKKCNLHQMDVRYLEAGAWGETLLS